MRWRWGQKGLQQDDKEQVKGRKRKQLHAYPSERVPWPQVTGTENPRKGLSLAVGLTPKYKRTEGREEDKQLLFKTADIQTKTFLLSIFI